MRINNWPKIVDIKFETPTERVVRSPFDKLPYCYVVGALENVLTEVQQNLFADCNTTLELLRLRFSQSCLEQKLFYHTFGCDGGQAKSLRLLKAFTWHRISRYSRTCIKRHRIKQSPSIKRSKFRIYFQLILVIFTCIKRSAPLLSPEMAFLHRPPPAERSRRVEPLKEN